ncbi:hypothetical protein TNCV_1637531 [Trichonephila clavipes]|nr:hypothetical protein TNCV_1637531 [Trichonephila clavipes]
MIKFIDFCEVWSLPESIARVAIIVGDPHCHTLGIDSKRLWMCSWAKQLPHVANVDLVWQPGCNLSQSLSNHGSHVFYR